MKLGDLIHTPNPIDEFILLYLCRSEFKNDKDNYFWIDHNNEIKIEIIDYKIKNDPIL